MPSCRRQLRSENDAMRILVLGAGAIGGYFGGRLAAAGADVTFLVRPRRAEQLRQNGLIIRSPAGDAETPAKTLLAEHATPGWDAIILACKAFDLDQAIATIRPAAPGALIIPQLNGIRHLEVLDAAFGADNVAGGMTQIGAVMEPDGTIRHLTLTPMFRYGPRKPSQRTRTDALQATLDQGGFGPTLSDNIMLDMWQKFAFLCTLAAMTCLMRATVGQIARTQEGTALMLDTFADCVATAEAAGYPPREQFIAVMHKRLSDPDSPLAASMLRDIQGGKPIEADHIVGDMLARAKAASRPATVLRAAYAHLEAYAATR
jgi:2-dehydropantoate 2-reductase